MITGIVLVVAGILIAVYPPLLAIIVAAFLMVTGALMIAAARYNRNHQRHFENPAVGFFFRH